MTPRMTCCVDGGSIEFGPERMPSVIVREWVLKRRHTWGDALSRFQSVSRPEMLVTIGSRISGGSISRDATLDRLKAFWASKLISIRAMAAFSE